MSRLLMLCPLNTQPAAAVLFKGFFSVPGFSLYLSEMSELACFSISNIYNPFVTLTESTPYTYRESDPCVHLGGIGSEVNRFCLLKVSRLSSRCHSLTENYYMFTTTTTNNNLEAYQKQNQQ